jgi:hypothetical protein
MIFGSGNMSQIIGPGFTNFRRKNLTTKGKIIGAADPAEMGVRDGPWKIPRCGRQ